MPMNSGIDINTNKRVETKRHDEVRDTMMNSQYKSKNKEKKI